MRELLADYRASAQPARAAKCARRAAPTTCAGSAPIAHKLKSSSRSVGALSLGDLCAELENSCRAGTPQEVSQGIAQFEAALRDVDAQIASLLA